MSPKQAMAYRLTGHIRRVNTPYEIKQLQKMVQKLTIKK